MPWAAVAAIAAPAVTTAIFGDNGQGAANQASANASNASAEAAGRQAAIAEDQWANYKKTYSPVEQKLADNALNAGSDANIATEGSIAGANAQQQIGLANAAKMRAQQRMGINPNSGAGLALADENANTSALSMTGAVNTARKTTQDSAFAKMRDTANAGNKAASNATSGMSSATSGMASAANSQANLAAAAGNQNAALGSLAATAFNGVAKKQGWTA